MRLLTYVLSMAALLASSPSHAQGFLGSPRDCEPALKKDLLQTVRSANQEYAYLNVIDQQTYEELKHSASLSASIPLTEGLINGSANYDDFSRKRASLFQQAGYSSSSAQSETELRIVTSPAAYDAYKACMETLARNNFGFYAFKTGETKDVVMIEVAYRPQPEVVKPIKISGTVINGRVPGVMEGQVFPSGATLVANGSSTIQIVRTNAKEMSIVVNGGGMTAPPIKSLWANAEPEQPGASAVVVVTRTVFQTSKTSTINTSSGWTHDNNNRRCSHPPCSSDNKWQADLVELRLNAPPGATLANPQKSCQSSADEGVCAHVDVDRLEIQGGGATAFLSLRASSRPARFTLAADVMTKTASTTEERLNPAVEIRVGGVSTLSVPDDATSAVIEIAWSGHREVVTPGSNSSDGAFTFLNKIVTPTATRYVYTLRKRTE